MKKYYTVIECAEVLHLSQETIKLWIRKKKLNAQIFLGRGHKYFISDDEMKRIANLMNKEID